MGKNIIVRLHVYLICFLLAFSPAYVYASAAPKLDFLSIANFLRDAGGASADYFFRRSANDPLYNAANDDYFETKSHRASNAELGKIGLFRMLNPSTVIGGAIFGFAISELVDAMQDEGWTVDVANQEIYKLSGGPQFFVSSQGFDKDFFSAEMPAIDQFIGEKFANSTPKPSFIGFSGDWPKPISLLKVNETAFRTFSLNHDGVTLRYSLGVTIFPTSKEVATDADVAAVLPNVSDNQIIALMQSPNYLAEPHTPTAAAASNAQPKTDGCPAGQTKVDGVCKPPESSDNKCPAGQVFDTATGKCKSVTPAQCPVGQVYDPVKKKCFAPKPDDDDDEPEGDDWPEFCEWAAPVCDFIEWARQDANKFDVSSVDIEDTSDDAQSITTQILTLGYVSGGVKSCPANYTFTFSVMGQGIDFDLSYKPLCDMLLMARPVVIAIAYFQAAKIVFVGRRD